MGQKEDPPDHLYKGDHQALYIENDKNRQEQLGGGRFDAKKTAAHGEHRPAEHKGRVKIGNERAGIIAEPEHEKRQGDVNGNDARQHGGRKTQLFAERGKHEKNVHQEVWRGDQKKHAQAHSKRYFPINCPLFGLLARQIEHVTSISGPDFCEAVPLDGQAFAGR